MKENSNISQETEDYRQARRDHLAEANLKGQKRTTFVVGPVAIAACLLITVMEPCWQFAAVLAVIVIIQFLFFVAYKHSRNKDYRAASRITMTCGVILGIAVNFFILDVIVIGVAAIMSAIFQGSNFSKRNTVLGFMLAVPGICMAVLFQYFNFFEIKEVNETTRLIVTGSVTVVLLLQTYMHMRQWYMLNDFLLGKLGLSGAAQNQVIKAIVEMQPVIEGAVDSIKTISNGFASQADEQATATSEVTATVAEVVKTSEQTMRTARETRNIAEVTRKGLLTHRKKLKSVENGFESVVDNIDNSRQQIYNLATKVEQIEEILNTNKAIGEHIKILSVNAAIEAAKAGEYGRRFKIVAGELRAMINSTDKNLASSHSMLEEIRQKSREASNAIGTGGDELTKYFSELISIGLTIEKTVESFVQTSQYVQQISHATEEQRVGMNEMGTTMVQLEFAADLLTESARELQVSVGEILNAQSELAKTLQV